VAGRCCLWWSYGSSAAAYPGEASESADLNGMHMSMAAACSTTCTKLYQLCWPSGTKCVIAHGSMLQACQACNRVCAVHPTVCWLLLLQGLHGAEQLRASLHVQSSPQPAGQPSWFDTVGCNHKRFTQGCLLRAGAISSLQGGCRLVECWACWPSSFHTQQSLTSCCM
jgi:hypothetical protein